MTVLSKEVEMATPVKHGKPRFSKTLFSGPVTAPAPPRTLDDVIVDARNALVTGQAVSCIACGGYMRPIRAGAMVRGGRCHNCGSTLS